MFLRKLLVGPRLFQTGKIEDLVFLVRLVVLCASRWASYCALNVLAVVTLDPRFQNDLGVMLSKSFRVVFGFFPSFGANNNNAV